MAKTKKSENVPNAMQEKFDGIVTITNDFAKQHLNSEYFTEAPTGEVYSTPIATLGLSIDDVFGYWFDFGDDSWPQINVTNIADKIPESKYPKITEQVGSSPASGCRF